MTDDTISWTMAALREILPRGCGVSARRSEPAPNFLTDEEAGRTKNVGDARRSNFLAGRRAAHEALAQIGMPGGRIPSGPKNEPIWPEGVAGSISHADGMAVAAVARTDVVTALGIDIESSGAVTTDVWPEVLCSSELAFVGSQSGATRDRLATAIFCLKEAFYKYQYPLARQWLEFGDVEIQMDAELEVCRLKPSKGIMIGGKAVAEFVGHYRIGENITVAAVF